MKKIIKWVAALLAVLVLVFAAVLLALQRWVGSDDFRGRVQAQAGAALGVPVKLGAIDVDAWPLPAVALGGIEVATTPPLTVERIEARPVWAGLLTGRLEIATLVVRKAVLPEPALAAVGALLQKKKAASAGTGAPAPSAPASGGMDWLPKRALLDNITWVDAKGNRTTVDSQLTLADDGWPDGAKFKVLAGRLSGAQATLARQSDHWTVQIDVGGGTVKGKLQLQPGAKGAPSLFQGQLDTAGVEVSALTAPSRSLTGRLEAKTRLRAEFREPGALAQALQSQTQFTVRDAVVHGIDLAKAVKSVGLNRGGETRLDTLAGQVATQGRAAQLTNLVASSGALTANGNVAVSPERNLSGRINVQLTAASLGGAVAVPLAVGGTLDAPQVTLTQGALLGAAIGTAVMPGVGTGAGAKLGDKVGQGLRGLFGK